MLGTDWPRGETLYIWRNWEGGEGREEKSHCIYAVDFMCAPLSGGCHFPVNISPFFDFREPASDMRETKRQFGEGNLERREGRLAPYFSAVPVAEGAEREREREKMGKRYHHRARGNRAYDIL